MQQITIEELLDRYNSGERNFTKIALSVNETIKYVDLSGINFRGSELHCGFENVDLRGANFSKTYLGCWFRESNLSGSDFRKFHSRKCLFEKSNLTQANFQGFSAFQSKFRESSLIGSASFDEAMIDINHIDLNLLASSGAINITSVI